MQKILNAHKSSPEELEILLKSNLELGLNSEEAELRLKTFGKNQLKERKKVSIIAILLENINNLTIYILFAVVLSLVFMGKFLDSIAVILAIFAALASGFFSEYKAQKNSEALNNIIATRSKVKRDGKIFEVDSKDLVPGDIIFLEEGDLIPADARIISSNNLASNEAALTGESIATEKSCELIKEDNIALGDKKNMLFSGTNCSRGNGFALVVATGNDTEIGHINKLINYKLPLKTPLQKEIAKLGKLLIVFALSLILCLLTLAFLLKMDMLSLIQTSLMLAISAIPEALPAVTTIILALGMQKMAQENSLLKNLAAVESLGNVTVICSDKTGTLTENQMTITKFILKDKERFLVQGLGYDPYGSIISQQDNPNKELLDEFLIAGLLASNAVISYKNSHFDVVGDPSEGAIVTLGMKGQITKEELSKKGYKKLNELPFSSKTKFMATLYELPDSSQRIYIKGAADVILAMSKEDKYWEEEIEKLASQALRVMAIAQIRDYKGENDIHAIEVEVKKTIEFLGILAMMDPPRADVFASIEQAQEAGIRIIMITGDHPKTASIIASQIGMKDTEKVLTGKDLDTLTSEELKKALETISVFARVSPENKLQIVQALNELGHITTMTGDGVNDGPALNSAHVGIAMGIRGTQVAKDASDMILVDDRFSTIINAIKQGRVIFSNIEKFIYFLFSCNTVEIMAVIMVIFLAHFFVALPLTPILPLQILWLNLMTDSLTGLSLAWEKEDEDILKQAPRDSKSAILNKDFLVEILSSSFLIALSSVAAFLTAFYLGYDELSVITISFTVMGFGQIFHVFDAKNRNKKREDRKFFDNKVLIFAVLITIFMQILAIYLPIFNKVLETKPLNFLACFIIFAFVAFSVVSVRLFRFFRKH